MPDQPVNKAEELLQRHARERRAQGGDFALHPATRRLLQGEVARQFGGAAQDGRRSAFAAWFTAWRSVSLAGALVVLLAFGAWMATRDSKGLADAKTPLAKADADFSGGMRGPLPAKAETAAKKESADLADKATESQAFKRKLSEAPAADGASALAMERESIESKQVARKDLPQPTAATKPPAAPAPVMAPTTAPSGPATRKMEFVSVGDGLDGSTQYAVNSLRAARDSQVANNGAEVDRQSPAAASQMLARNEAGGRAGNSLKSAPQPTGIGGAGQVASKAIANDQVQNAPVGGAFGNSNDAYGNRENLGALSVNNSYNFQQTVGGAQTRAFDNNTQTIAPAQNRGAVQQNVQNSEVFYAAAPAVNDRNNAQVQELRAQVEQTKANFQQPLKATILSRFSIEQVGNAVRLTDADGSLYEGAVVADVPSAAPERATIAKGGGTELTRQRRASAGQSQNFRAVGTNRTLNQFVVVNGKFSAETIGAVLANNADERLNATQRLPANPTLPVMRNYNLGRANQAQTNTLVIETNVVNSIEGTVRVGTAPERSFRAQRRAP